MRARLVGHDVGQDAALEQRAEDLAGRADDADRAPVDRPRAPPRPRAAPRRGRARRGRGSAARRGARGGAASTSTTRQTPSSIVTASGCAPPMPPQPAVSTTRPRRRAVEALARDGRERLERPLQDALRADVDPRAGRHLAVHRQALGLEPPERLPVGPVRHEQAVGDQHARRHLVRAEHADRLAALHEQRLVVLEPAQRGDDGVEGLPRARRAPGAAVDDEVGRDPPRPRGRGCS